jgi:probable F420-dependent oxidoreductase
MKVISIEPVPLHSTQGRVSRVDPMFSFAVYPYDRLLDSGDLARIAQAGEAARFDAVNFPDHLLPPLASHDVLHNRTWWNLSVLCAFLAGRTERLRLFFNVLVLPYYPPVQLAKSLVTLDCVSQGRLIVGVGAGWYEEEFEQLGVPFAERGAITDEYLEAMIELWTAEEPRFHGKYVSFEEVSFYPKPVQKPHPLLIVGGTGARPFRRAVAHGGGWAPLSGSSTTEQLAEHIRQISALLRQAGRDPAGFVFGRSMSMAAGSEGMRAAAHVRGGDDPPAASATVQPVPATAKEAIAQVEQLLAVGVNLVTVVFGWDTIDDFVAQLESFGRDVITHFR